MMNILHVSRTMGQGGAEKVVFQVCGIDGFNHFVASTGGHYVEELKKNNVKHFCIPDLASKNPFLMLRTLKILKKIVKDNQIDVIHSHHRMAAFYAQILHRVLGVRLIYTAHIVFFDKKKMTRFALRDTRVIAVGDEVKKNLTDLYGMKPSLVEVIFNTVDDRGVEYVVDELLAKLRKDGMVLAGVVARLVKEKGVDVFVKSIARVQGMGGRVAGIIIGDGVLRGELENLADGLGLSEDVYFMGFRKDTLNLMSQLDFVVLPSFVEGFPLTPIEAFSQKKAVVASDIPNNMEIVKNGENGLLFRRGDEGDLADRILRLSSDRGLCETLGNGAYRSYVDKYSYDIFVTKYSELYMSIEKEMQERQ